MFGRGYFFGAVLDVFGLGGTGRVYASIRFVSRFQSMIECLC